MAGGRNSPALFELIRDKSGAVPKPPQPQADPAARPTPPPIVPHVAPAPKPPPPPAAALPASAPLPPAPGPLPAPTGLDFRQTLTLTTSRISMAVVVVLVVILAIWVIAFRLGHDRGEEKVLRDLNLSAAPVQDPLKPGNIPANPNLLGDAGKAQPKAQPRTATDPRKPAPTGPAGPTGQTPPPQPQPTTAGDPRVIGLNYLVLALKMDKETADRAAAFLGSNGVRALVIPVARTGGGANNPPSYALYAADGITPEQLKARAPERTELEAKVARLGKIWQKEHKGQTDFSQTYWEKKKP